MNARPSLALASLLLTAPALSFAQAQATIEPDGLFRYAFGAGASYASGNTSTASVNLSGDGVKATTDSKWQSAARPTKAAPRARRPPKTSS